MEKYIVGEAIFTANLVGYQKIATNHEMLRVSLPIFSPYIAGTKGLVRQPATVFAIYGDALHPKIY